MSIELSQCGIWVVIPAYRASETIRAVLTSIPDWVEGVVVVDDASTDDTASVVESADDPRVVLVKRPKNGGVGAAVCDGYQRALELDAQVVVKMDADAQMDPGQMPRLVAPIIEGRADYAKGNRFRHWNALRSMPRGRLFGNAVLSFLVKMASGYWDIIDPTNGYTAIHRVVLSKLQFDDLAKRYFFESDMLIHLGTMQAVVVDVPMPARYGDENSSLSLSRAATTFPGKLVRGFVKRAFWRHILMELTPAGLLLFVGVVLCFLGGAFGLYHWIKSIATGIVATTGTVMIAVLPIVVGVVFLTEAFVLETQSMPRKVLSRNEMESESIPEA